MKNIKKILFTAFAIGCFTIGGANESHAATKTITKKSSYKSLVGLTVATHTATTVFSYDGTKLLSNKAIYTDYWTAPLNGVSSTSSKWDWYDSSSGRSNSLVKFYFGVPTPWGAVGSNYSSRLVTDVYKNGTWK
ncbi:hypothetical protein [Bacillus sp. AFS041924]|uniref:hypothetical protein n=1 Tax=Bacillus sp. AFS041924 TaxID=2033503 RepID=UPI000BFDD8C6|nr:hypothetical protein [Bacillus sp. AFS041924]PGS50517.1 hypothetical protein COC46_13000 [Bacillus sp. AFS041924]